MASRSRLVVTRGALLAGYPLGLRFVALMLVVAALHLWFTLVWLPSHIGFGASNAAPKRMQVAFVRELTPQVPVVPPLAAVQPKPKPKPEPATAVLSAAPKLAASAPNRTLIDEALVVDASRYPSAAEGLATDASAAPADVGPALPQLAQALQAPEVPPTPAVEWPPSTRLSYKLTGNYRGEVLGHAQVEWLMQDKRYQVFMDLGIGPAFAPLASRRVSSEGWVTPQGLAPSRAIEETRALLGAPRRLVITMDAEQLVLANGRVHPRPAGVQDSASQFVQLTWLFTTQPDLLQVGRSVTLPLALPYKLEPWTYDVVAQVTLQTGAGPVETFHVKPRRQAKPGVDLTAEIWVAPSWQYLPVRIFVRQDEQTYLDLVIERLPQQAQAQSEAHSQVQTRPQSTPSAQPAASTQP